MEGNPLPTEDSPLPIPLLLADVVERGTRALPPHSLAEDMAGRTGAQGVALSLVPHADQWQLLYASTDLALAGEEAQFLLGEGPTCAAAAERRPVAAGDLHRPPAASPGGRLAGRLPGVGALLALPVRIGRHIPGVLTLYYAGPRRFDFGGARRVPRPGDSGSWAVYDVSPGPTAILQWGHDTRRRTAAAHSWRRIHQAVGILSARHGCTTHAALAHLRARTIATEQRLSHVADALHRDPAGLPEEPRSAKARARGPSGPAATAA